MTKKKKSDSDSDATKKGPMCTMDPQDGDIYCTSHAMSVSHGGVTATGVNTPPRRHVDVSVRALTANVRKGKKGKYERGEVKKDNASISPSRKVQQVPVHMKNVYNNFLLLLLT